MAIVVVPLWQSWHWLRLNHTLEQLSQGATSLDARMIRQLGKGPIVQLSVDPVIIIQERSNDAHEASIQLQQNLRQRSLRERYNTHTSAIPHTKMHKREKCRIPSPTANPSPTLHTLRAYSLPISSGPCLSDLDKRVSSSSIRRSLLLLFFLRFRLSRSFLKTSRPEEKLPTIERTQEETFVCAMPAAAGVCLLACQCSVAVLVLGRP